jgi:hypothetical protein
MMLGVGMFMLTNEFEEILMKGIIGDETKRDKL